MKIFTFFAIACLASLFSGKIISQVYVNTGDNLQEAIDLAEKGATVYVSAGIYYGNFFMKEGVNVSGSWNEDFMVQDTILYASVLDAQGSGRVVTQNSAFTKETTTTWSGLIIQNGNTTENGGGVYLNTYGVLDSCMIRNCIAASGGGIYDDNSNAYVKNSIITKNSSNANPGGGFRMRGTIENSLIDGNFTTKAGGGGHSQAGTIRNCIVVNNESTGDNAGGLRLYNKCTVINSLIANNISASKAGGILCNAGAAANGSSIINCTIVGNEANTGGGAGGIMVGDENATGGVFVNNIVWANSITNNSTTGQIYYVSRFTTRYNNAVYNQAVGTPSITLSGENDADNGPRFTNPENGDYTLMDNSICIDSGENSYISTYNILSDLNGGIRIINQTVDIGAYENQKSPTTNLQDIPTKSLLFYPNPATEYIYINNNISRASVFTLEGKQLLSEYVCGFLSVKDLNKGTYLLRLITDEGISNNQILIIR